MSRELWAANGRKGANAGACSHSGGRLPINTGFNDVALCPSTAALKEKVPGEHFAGLEIGKDEEIYLKVQSIRLKEIKSLVQWIAGALFGVVIAYLFALLGFRV